MSQAQTLHRRRHHIGEFVASGDWSDYWSTCISRDRKSVV